MKRVEFNACSSHNLRESDKDAANTHPLTHTPPSHTHSRTKRYTHTHTQDTPREVKRKNTRKFTKKY